MFIPTCGAPAKGKSIEKNWGILQPEDVQTVDDVEEYLNS